MVAGILLSARATVAATMAPSDIQGIFFNGQPFTASTPGGTKFKMIFKPDGTMTREPRGKSGAKSSGTWKLDVPVFARPGSRLKPIATPSSQVGEINGRFKKVQPQLRYGRNSYWGMASTNAGLTCQSMVAARCRLGSIVAGLAPKRALYTCRFSMTR